jgi:hypothetical protein
MPEDAAAKDKRFASDRASCEDPSVCRTHYVGARRFLPNVRPSHNLVIPHRIFFPRLFCSRAFESIPESKVPERRSGDETMRKLL